MKNKEHQFVRCTYLALKQIFIKILLIIFSDKLLDWHFQTNKEAIFVILTMVVHTIYICSLYKTPSLMNKFYTTLYSPSVFDLCWYHFFAALRLLYPWLWCIPILIEQQFVWSLMKKAAGLLILYKKVPHTSHCVKVEGVNVLVLCSVLDTSSLTPLSSSFFHLIKGIHGINQCEYLDRVTSLNYGAKGLLYLNSAIWTKTWPFIGLYLYFIKVPRISVESYKTRMHLNKTTM